MKAGSVTSFSSRMAIRTACISVNSAFSLGKHRQVMLRALIALILITPFLIIAASPVSAQSGDSVGAIYFDEDERVFGVSSDHTDRDQAERVAKKSCEASGGRKCIFAVVFEANQCGALADGNDDWSADYGSSNASARSNAISECRKRTGGCKVIVAACNQPSSRAAAAPPPSCPSGFDFSQGQCVRSGAPAPTGNLIYPLQTEFKRLDCMDGRVDGVWGNGSQDALEEFVSNYFDETGVRLGNQRSQAVLNAARKTKTGFCMHNTAQPSRPNPVRKKVRCSKVKFGFTRGNTCACTDNRVFNGTACVRRQQSGGGSSAQPLPFCANAVNAICERQAGNSCDSIKSDKKFDACFDRATLACERQNGCRN